jgi:hypothetical protein
MSDAALSNAKKRLDELAAEINRTAARLEELRREHGTTHDWIMAWHKFAGEKPDAADEGDESKNRRPRPINPRRTDVGRVAWSIISRRGRPIPRDELFKELAAQGMIIQGKDPEMVLSTMMWRMQDVFVRLPGFGYWKKATPYAPAAYIPGMNVEDDGEDAKVAELAKAEGED